MTQASLPPDAQAVLDYWLGDALTLGWPSVDRHSMWFRGGPAVDADIQSRFGPLVEQALDGALRDPVQHVALQPAEHRREHVQQQHDAEHHGERVEVDALAGVQGEAGDEVGLLLVAGGTPMSYRYTFSQQAWHGLQEPSYREYDEMLNAARRPVLRVDLEQPPPLVLPQDLEVIDPPTERDRQ